MTFILPSFILFTTVVKKNMNHRCSSPQHNAGVWIYRQTFSLINCWSVNISLKKFQSSCFCLQIFQWLTPLNAFCQDRCYNCSMSNCRLIIFLKGKLNKKIFSGLWSNASVCIHCENSTMYICLLSFSPAHF